MKKTAICLFLLMLIIITGCSRISSTETLGQKSGFATISIDWPGKRNMNILRIPESAISISVTASAGDMAPIRATIAYPQTLATLEIKVGDNRSITAEAVNGSGKIVATGEARGISIASNSSNPIALVLADIDAPSPPVGLSVYSSSDEVFVSWNVNTEPDIAGYNLYRMTTPESSPIKINNTLITGNNYEDGNIVFGARYYYKLTSLDQSGNESAYSACVSIKVHASMDIVLILDNTGSMSSSISNIKNSILEFAASFEANSFDCKYALVTFGDSATHPTPAGPIAEEGGFRDDNSIQRPVMNLGTASELHAALSSEVIAEGGADIPENPLDAILWGYNNISFRPGAEKIFIVVTDANGHQNVPEDTSTNNLCTTTISEVINLLSSNAIVYSISPNYASIQYPYCDARRLADGLGEGRTTPLSNTSGKWYLFDDGSNLVSIGLAADILASE